METTPSNVPTENDGARWPAACMVAYGTFGGPAARRYHYRSFFAILVALLCFCSGILFRPFMAKSGLDAITAFGPAIAFVYVAWEFRRYLAALDELARRIQLESIAWTYLCGLVAAILLAGVSVVYGIRFNPIWVFLLEPVRAGWLYFVSRRYQ